MLELGERIYNLRKRSALSQEEFADRLGVSRQAVSKWETGQSVPDSEKAAAMAKFFGVSLDYLLNGEEVATPLPMATAEGGAYSVACAAQQDGQAVPTVKKRSWLKALLIAAIVTLCFMGLCAIVTFIFALVVMKTANLADPETFYMLIIVVPGWTVVFIIAFIVSFVVLKKRKK